MLYKKKKYITEDDFDIAKNDLFIKNFPDEVFVKYASEVTGDDIANRLHWITREEDKVRLKVLLSQFGEQSMLTSDFIFTNDYMEYSSAFSAGKPNNTTRIVGWIRDFLDLTQNKKPTTNKTKQGSTINNISDDVFVQYASMVTGEDISRKLHYLTREEDRTTLSVPTLHSSFDKNSKKTKDYVYTSEYMEYPSKPNETTRIYGWTQDYLARKDSYTNQPEMLDD